MKLHENIDLYTDAIRFTSQEMNLKPEYVEKDYWLTYALFTIFSNEIGKDTVFKGGTALSKCYNMIERFSEDIDLVVLRREGETNSKLKSKIKAVSTLVETIMPEVNIEGITQKMGMNRKTAHNYNKQFSGNYGQVRDVIIVESTWLGYYEPYTSKSIISFVGQMMIDNNQSNIARENDLLAFDVLVLEPIRTICEKIMSLVRFSYGEQPIEDLKQKIRHTYDLHQLLKKEEFLVFFNSKNFDEMLIKVANDDVVSFKNKNKWLAHHPKDALFFKDLENVWERLKATYNNDFKTLVFGELPVDTEVFETLKMIQNRINDISWSIIIDTDIGGQVGGQIGGQVGDANGLVERLVEGLVESQQMIVRLVEKNPEITIKELSEQIGISTTAIDKNIVTLKEKSIIRRVGGNKHGRWEIILDK